MVVVLNPFLCSFYIPVCTARIICFMFLHVFSHPPSGMQFFRLEASNSLDIDIDIDMRVNQSSRDISSSSATTVVELCGDPMAALDACTRTNKHSNKHTNKHTSKECGGGVISPHYGGGGGRGGGGGGGHASAKKRWFRR